MIRTFVKRGIIPTYVCNLHSIIILTVLENEKIDPTSSPKNHTTDLT